MLSTIVSDPQFLRDIELTICGAVLFWAFFLIRMNRYPPIYRWLIVAVPIGMFGILRLSSIAVAWGGDGSSLLLSTSAILFGVALARHPTARTWMTRNPGLGASLVGTLVSITVTTTLIGLVGKAALLVPMTSFFPATIMTYRGLSRSRANADVA